jgi:hypothetical protein
VLTPHRQARNDAPGPVDDELQLLTDEDRQRVAAMVAEATRALGGGA